MTLWAYALRTVAAAKPLIPMTGTGLDTLVEECVNDASQMTEGAWGREIVSRGSVTEYYTLREGRPDPHILLPNQGPIVSIASVYEDTARAFVTPLAVNTDFIVSQVPTGTEGKLIRVASSLQKSWASGWRAIKVTGIFGYQNTTGNVSGAQGVPPGILGVFDELLAWLYRHRSKQEGGRASVSDETGSRTFWAGPPMITDGMYARLDAVGRVPATLRGWYGERDA